MRRVVLFLAALSPLACSAAPYSPEALAKELRTLEEGRANLPEAWEVQTPEGTYSVSSTPLQLLREKDPDSARQWLQNMAFALDGYGHGVAPSDMPTRARLDLILSRPEFKRAETVSAWAALKKRIGAWIQRMLIALLGSAANQKGIAAILFWTALLVASGFLCWFIVRWYKRGSTAASVPAPVQQPARSSDSWAGLARAAAAVGDFRSAIHCCYWAGVMLLREKHTPGESPGLTPREYLRLYRDRANVEQPLAGLTRSLERFWYAGQASGEPHFAEAKEHLRDLGCPLD